MSHLFFQGMTEVYVIVGRCLLERIKCEMAEVFVTIDELPQAGVKKATDAIEVSQDGKSRRMTIGDLTTFNAYDVGVQAGPVLSMDNQCFIIQNDDVAVKNVVLPENLLPNRARTIVVVIYGNVGVINWDPKINWSDNRPPQIAKTNTVIGLLWDGFKVHGGPGPSY